MVLLQKCQSKESNAESGRKENKVSKIYIILVYHPQNFQPWHNFQLYILRVNEEKYLRGTIHQAGFISVRNLHKQETSYDHKIWLLLCHIHIELTLKFRLRRRLKRV